MGTITAVLETSPKSRSKQVRSRSPGLRVSTVTDLVFDRWVLRPLRKLISLVPLRVESCGFVTYLTRGQRSS